MTRKKASSRKASSGSSTPAQRLTPSWVPERVCPNLCIDKDCRKLIQATGYCRLLYIKNWQMIQRKREILSKGQLDRYIGEIIEKYPGKYIEAIREDMSSSESFGKIVAQMELNEDSIDAMNGDEEVEAILETVKSEIEEDSFE